MRFLISGYYGFGNIGDEALLGVIVAELRTRYPLAEIEVLTAKPQEARHALRVDATPRGDPRAVWRSLSRADVVLSGGGGLLQTTTSLRSLLYYAGIIRRAARSGKATVIFAQSIGPLDFIGRQVVRETCRGVAVATLRDARSCALLHSLLPALALRRTADPVFLYDEGPEEDDLSALGLGDDSDPLVLVSVRPWRNMAVAQTRIAEAVDRLASLGARVGFVPFAGPGDAEACTVVMRACRSRPTLLPLDDVASAARVIRRARLVIGMRLHALILAARFGVPFLALAYDPKVGALLEDLEYPVAPLWTAGQATNGVPAAALANEAWNRRDELAAHLRAAQPRMRALALENFDALDAVVARRERPHARRHEGMASP